MNIRNESAEFDVQFNDKVYTVLTGELEVDNALGNYILRKAIRWGFKVVPSTKTPTPAIVPTITQVNSDENKDLKEAALAELVNDEPKKSGRPVKK